MRCGRWLALCVVVWSYPFAPDNALGRAVQTTMEVRICEGVHGHSEAQIYRTAGQQFLEFWKVTRFVDGAPIKEALELRLPWGERP